MTPSLLHHLTELEKLVSKDATGDVKAANDPEAAKLFQKLWENAPQQWKSGCMSQPRDRVRLSSWIEDPITVHEDVIKQVDVWNDDPSLFFAPGAPNSPPTNPFIQLYNVLFSVSGGNKHIKPIHLRIAKIGLSRIKGRLQHRYTVGDAERELVTRIQINGETEIENAKKWSREGDKLDSFTEEFGGLGWAICMPEDISDYKLVRIPPDDRGNAIKRLVNRGIRNREQSEVNLCYKVGAKIEAYMKGMADSYFLVYEPAPPIPIPKTSKKRKKGQNTNVKRNTMRPAGADQPQTSPTPGQNIQSGSAGNLLNHQTTAWIGLREGSQVPAADPSTAINNLGVLGAGIIAMDRAGIEKGSVGGESEHYQLGELSHNFALDFGDFVDLNQLGSNLGIDLHQPVY